jgi:DNA-binding SARP family transcriptional activator
MLGTVLTCRVLGPTEIDAGARRVPLGGPLPRRLITALIAAESRPMTEQAIATAVWGDETPASATISLQSQISRLRTALGPFRDSLERVDDGYRLRAATDATTFAAHVDRGRLLIGAHPYEAARAFTAALRLWRGTPFADLPAAPSVALARARLEELRAVAVEERLAAHLAVGSAPAAIPDLAASVRAQPHRPRRWELLVIALYRSGRQTDALSALDRAGDLAGELKPLRDRILLQDPQLLRPPAPGPGPTLMG